MQKVGPCVYLIVKCRFNDLIDMSTHVAKQLAFRQSSPALEKLTVECWWPFCRACQEMCLDEAFLTSKTMILNPFGECLKHKSKAFRRHRHSTMIALSWRCWFHFRCPTNSSFSITWGVDSFWHKTSLDSVVLILEQLLYWCVQSFCVNSWPRLLPLNMRHGKKTCWAVWNNVGWVRVIQEYLGIVELYLFVKLDWIVPSFKIYPWS